MFYLEKEGKSYNIVHDYKDASHIVVYRSSKNGKERERVSIQILSQHSTIDKKDFEPGTYDVELLNDEQVLLGYSSFKIKSKGPILIMMLMLLTLLIILLYSMFVADTKDGSIFGRPITDVSGNKGSGGFTTDMSKIQDELNKNTHYLNIKLSSYINIVNGEGYFKIHNANEDKSIQVSIHPYDSVTRQYDQNTEIYISPLLMPDENVEKGSLCKTLEFGEHRVIAMFHAYDVNGNYLGCAGQELILNVN